MKGLINNEKVILESGGFAKFFKVVSQIFGPSEKRTQREIHYKNEHKKADRDNDIKKANVDKIIDLIKESKNSEEMEMLNFLYRKLESGQENLKNTLSIAQQELENNPHLPISEDDVEKDFITKWANNVEATSNSNMQQLYAKALAGEIRRPGSFSKKTLDALHNMSVNDMKSFERAISISSWSNNKNLGILLIEFENPETIKSQEDELDKYGCEYSQLLSLQDYGLIANVDMPLTWSTQGNKATSQSSGSFLLEIESENNLDYSFIRITEIGKELASLARVDPNETYFENLQKHLIAKGSNSKLTRKPLPI